MPRLPRQLYTAAQVRELDRRAIEEQAIPGHELMERAGAAALSALRCRWPQVERIAVLCGPGNNGGDGYILARRAGDVGIVAEVVEAAAHERLTGDAATAREGWLRAGGRPAAIDDALAAADLVVDALLGTGVDRPLTGGYADLVAAVNNAGRPVVALDIPSGLDADCGEVQGVAVRADLTVTFIGLKRGLFTACGPDLAGTIVFDPLGVPEAACADLEPAAVRLDAELVAGILPRRRRTAHKGANGHVLVVGGDHGMGGAALLAGEAALRVGAGLVSVATRPEYAAPFTASRPEIMCHGVGSSRDLLPLLRRATVVAIGPGLGQGRWGRALLGAALDARLPLVVDADALNLLAADPVYRSDWVLTPHPGEAARLLGERVADVQHNRFIAAAGVMASYGGTCVLKGAGTIVHGPDNGLFVCSGGNPGMAAGGMGDLLTGVIAGLIAQGMAPEAAAWAGVALHAGAGDEAAAAGERGMIASDLLAPIRRLVG